MTGTSHPGTLLVTGGAGFVGTNLADRAVRAGWRVLVYDNLSRPGVERNLAWLKSSHGDRIDAIVADIRDGPALAGAVRRATAVAHLAAQVAVTSSLADPVGDFSINAAGTLGLLEAVRARPVPPPVIFSSTNKVYGALADIELVEEGDRYWPARREFGRGIDERRPLAFHSPYGCSKGAADQYMLDYARCFGLPTAVFRMSCIYGPHQVGTEDQGWVAHFLLSAMRGDPLTLFGTGRQVRDILHVDDLVAAFLAAFDRFEAIAGEAFNLGGGPTNAVALLEVVDAVAALEGRRPGLRFDRWRTGDQPWYVSDTRRIETRLAWAPTVSALDGIAALHRWLKKRADCDPPGIPAALGM